MCSSASVILASIDTILVSFQPNCSISKLMVLNMTSKVVDYRNNPLQNSFHTYKYCDNTRKYHTLYWLNTRMYYHNT